MPIQTNSTSYSVRDFLAWQRDSVLDLRPPFQRKAVWRPILKSSLIDSVLRGYPIPALFLQDRTDPNGFSRRLNVVDGQQRLRTILAFVDVSSLRDADSRDDFSIMRIHDEDRAGFKFAELAEAEKHQILATRLNVYIVDGTVPDSEILQIFRRMNSYGARLNDQELRNAQYSGLFKELSFQLAADFLDTWLAWKLFNTQSVAEMRDAEFVSELLLLFISGTPASPKKALKDAYENWEDQFPRADDAVARFKDVFRMIEEAVGPEGEPLRRLSGKMWMYSLCDALQQIRFGGPIESGGSGKPVPTVRLKGLIDAANAAISAGELPSAVEKATRGAATDPSSRAARSTFLVDLYGP